MKRAAAVLTVVTLSLVGITAPAEASKGKHKGWTWVAACSGGGAQPFTPAGGASCPSGHEVVFIKMRRGSQR